MKIVIGVEGFGKIKKADIDISNYSVFVGDNNSGKTYLMQLIYGVLQYLKIPQNYESKYVGELFVKYRQNEDCVVSPDEITVVCRELNDYLENNKRDIVKRIFQKEINIESLNISVEMEADCMNIRHKREMAYNTSDGSSSEYESWNVYYKGEQRAVFGVLPGASDDSVLLNVFLFAMGIGQNYRLFIPASRTGIQLLYKEFYANKIDSMVSDGRVDKNDHLGLTMPIYDFLRFLQTYNQNPEYLNNDIMGFIDANMINGELLSIDNTLTYVSKDNNISIPLYLASSMINEIAPIIMTMTNGRFYDFLFIDEVETSLHPKKQREMARLLTRINNKKTRLLISTHSDTMASYLGLMLLMSNKAGNTDIELEKMNLDKNDILQNQEMHFYQFDDCGSYSLVKEIPIYESIDVGPDFEQFNDSLEQLYDLAKSVIGTR